MLENRKDTEVVSVRLENIKLMNKLKKQEAELKSKVCKLSSSVGCYSASFSVTRNRCVTTHWPASGLPGASIKILAPIEVLTGSGQIS